MIRLFQSGWMCALLGTLAYWTVTIHLLLGLKPPPKVHASSWDDQASTAGPSWEFFNPEIDRLAEELKREREALHLRKKELDELALRLAAERAEINQVTQTVHRLQMDFDQGFLKVQEEETANLKKLARLFTTMDPEITVKLFDKMSDDEVVKYLVQMKDTDTVAILEAMAKKGDAQTRRVGSLTERLRETLYRNAPKP